MGLNPITINPNGPPGPQGLPGETGPPGPPGPAGAINSDITAIVTLTQAEYTALSPKVATTLYIVTPD